MDFFEAQDRARRRSKSLVLLFALAVAGTIAAGYVSTLLILNQAGNVERRGQSFQYSADHAAPIVWWNPQVFLWVAAGTIGVVGFASLYKWSQMRSGGAAVAEMVGGRAVDLNTTDLRERQLLNVVEEMAIASGIPVPAVYILENEPGLNAFAAGLRTTDAAVAVTRGTLNRLTRDELQGVVAHEFSHILNGDMRLNVQISAIVFGILVVGLIGRGVLRGIMFGRVRSSGGGKDKGAGTLVFIGIGLALFLIGYVGYFFGRLIQAAVSRQREFLADASAVQFTRNADGIAGALKKIGGYALGGTIVNNHAGEIGHFFFAQAFRSGLTGLLSTHPALDKRIRAIDPRWDGKLFEPPEVVDVAQESFAMAGFTKATRSSGNKIARGPEASQPDLAPPIIQPCIAFQPARIVADIGALTDAHFRHAHRLLESIPEQLRHTARDAATAPALVYGLLLSGDQVARDKQQALVAQHAGPAAANELAALQPALSGIDAAVRLPLLQLALAALRQMDAAARDRFATTLDELVHADGVVTPYEYAMQKMVLNQILADPKKSRHVQFDSFAAVRNEIAVVLSALAHFSPTNSAVAFAAGAAQLPVLANQIDLLASSASGLEQVDAALDKLAASSLPIKKRLLVAAGHVISSDGSVTTSEGELYRALAATLDVPMPSLSAA